MKRAGVFTHDGMQTRKKACRVAPENGAPFQVIQLKALQGPLFGVHSQVSAQVRKICSIQNSIYSRYGKEVGFVRNGDIYAVAVAGGPARRLTFTKGSEWCPAWSPDGRWIAFRSNEGGTARVWRIAAEGGRPKAFDKTRLSQQLVWAPGARILYQRPGNRNFHLLDPETEKETPLVRNESVGVIFSPRYSPDGARVVVAWVRPTPGGMTGSLYWAISLTGSAEVFLGADAPMPLGWSADGAWLYTSDTTSGRKRFLRMPEGGGKAETVFEWPFGDEIPGFCSPFSADTRWLCTVESRRSDIWLVEHLDPNAE